jgi:hypothetical protein
MRIIKIKVLKEISFVMFPSLHKPVKPNVTVSIKSDIGFIFHYNLFKIFMLDFLGLQPTGRALCRCGISIPSAHNRC